jgi:dienelactone hydrolase
VLLAAPRAVADDYSQPGPFAAGWRTVTVTRADSSTFNARLHYPALSAGQNAPFDPGGAPYAAISFGHGFLSAVSLYQSTLAHLATHGYLVIASESYGGLFPDHAAFAADLSRCLTWLEAENASAGSVLFGAVDTARFGLSGHSMGGGCSILATAADSRVRALANLAAAETTPSAIAQMANIEVPTALIAGSMDSITPLSAHGQPMYNAGNAPKQLPVIVGGYHCGFIDSAIPFCDSGAISRSQQLALTRRLLTEFFHLHLRGEQAVWRAVWGPEAFADPAIARQADAGMLLAPGDIALSGPGGAPVATPVTLRNTSGRDGVFEFLIDGNTWFAGLAPEQTPLLAPGESFEFTLIVVLGDQPDRAEDQFLVTAVRSDEPGTRAYARVHASRAYAPGDLDCNGAVNNFDIDPFVLALSDPAAYAAGYPDCDAALADVNGDGAVNNFDIDAFVALLTGG